MQILLIAAIMVAFLGGILSKCSVDHSASGGSFFSALGFKSNEDIQKEQLNKLLGKYLKDKDSLVGDLQQDVGPLSQAVKDASGKDNMDLLRLKNLMAQFEDQNVLMVEDGKELIAFNEKQKKINKKMAEKSQLNMFLSKLDQAELLQKQRDILAQMKDNQAVRNNPQLADKVDAVYNKIMPRLDALKQQEDQIRSMKQNGLRNTVDLKEKIKDQKRRTQDLMQDNKDRMRDQMERIRDKSRR